MLTSEFREGVATDEDNARKYAVGDWSDTVGTLFAHLSEFGSPISYFLPLPDEEIFALTFSSAPKSLVESDSGRVFSFSDPMKEFVLHLMASDSPCIAISNDKREVKASDTAVDLEQLVLFDFKIDVPKKPVAA